MLAAYDKYMNNWKNILQHDWKLAKVTAFFKKWKKCSLITDLLV